MTQTLSMADNPWRAYVPWTFSHNRVRTEMNVRLGFPPHFLKLEVMSQLVLHPDFIKVSVSLITFWFMYSPILRAATTQRELWTAGLGNWPLWYFSDFVCNKERNLKLPGYDSNVCHLWVQKGKQATQWYVWERMKTTITRASMYNKCLFNITLQSFYWENPTVFSVLGSQRNPYFPHADVEMFLSLRDEILYWFITERARLLGEISVNGRRKKKRQILFSHPMRTCSPTVFSPLKLK